MDGQVTEAAALSEPSDPAGPAESPAAAPNAAALPAERSWSFFIATLAAVVPVVWATARAVHRDWLPTQDTGYLPIRAWNVLSAHPPLIGPPASASDQVGRHIYQPGALQYDVLAVPIRLFGRGPGTAIAIALVNVLAIVGIAWLLRRLLGPALATVAMAATALLVWSMGSEILFDPWATYSPLLAFGLLLVAVWCVVAGDLVALPVLVVAGSYVAQVHLSFAVLVAGLVGFVLAVGLVRLLVQRRRDPAWWPQRRPQVRRWGTVGLVTGLICWAQPIFQQFFGPGEGNLLALVRSADTGAPTPAVSTALRAYGGTIAVPPAWLPPSFGSPSFAPDGDGRPVWLAAGGLVLVVALVAVLGWRAYRRSSTAVAAGAATALMALFLGLVTVLRVPMTFGLTWHYVRWMWPLGLTVWMVIGLAVLDEVRARTRRPFPVARLAAVAAAVALVAGAFALPTADNQTSTSPWAIDATHELGPEMVAAVRDKGLVEVEMPLSWGTILAGPPLLGELQDAGIRFGSTQEIIVRQLGSRYELAPDEADIKLVIRGAAGAPLPGLTEVTSWSGLSADDEAELNRLSDKLVTAIERRGLHLVPEADESMAAMGQGPIDVDAAEADPRAFLEDTGLWSACCWLGADYAGHSLVDADAMGLSPDLVERWGELAFLRDVAQLTIYITK